jgi:hypothetical protein
MPSHWRKITHTIVAEDLEEPFSLATASTTPSVRSQAVRGFLRQALGPFLDYTPDANNPEESDEFERVLEDCVDRIIKDKKLVETIWRLKKSQSQSED